MTIFETNHRKTHNNHTYLPPPKFLHVKYLFNEINLPPPKLFHVKNLFNRIICSP